MEDATTKVKVTLKQEQTKGNSALLDKLNIVQVAIVSNEGRMESPTEGGPETPKNLILEIDSKLKGYDVSTCQKLEYVKPPETIPIYRSQTTV